MNINIRQANENDRSVIALCIAEGFKKDFDVLCKNTHTVAAAISTGIQISKFYVAESQNKVVGVVAISDCNDRAAATDITSYKENFGFIKGNIANLVLREEFESSLDYPPTTGYIEFAAVRCYSALGFKEFKRVHEKHSKQKGFSAKIYMRYQKK